MVIDAGPVEALLELIRQRARRPSGMMALQRFVPLSERESDVVAEAIETIAVELMHAIEEGRQDAMMTVPDGPCSLDSIEREALLKAMVRASGRQNEAAKLLGISVRVMNYKLQQHGIVKSARGGQAMKFVDGVSACAV